MKTIGFFFSLFLLLTVSTAAAQSPDSLTGRYKSQSERLIQAALADKDGYADLATLCDHFGNRISGSQQLQRAIEWSAQRMRERGLVNVTLQPVMVPHWVRGSESAAIVEPVARPLHMLGLGMSEGTPKQGIIAEAVVVGSFDELNALGEERVKGRIVVFNVPFTSYDKTAIYRFLGASRASKLGAVGVLLRSVTPLAMQAPHTGMTFYEPGVVKIPAAAISVEDAEMLARLAAEGKPVKVHLQMDAHLEADVPSANVFGEILGSEHPEQIVAIGGHSDSWDVGQGAQDDGAGIISALEAVSLIQKLGLKPRRTIRLVFWVNEENGVRGGKAYRDALGDDVKNHVAAIESDMGTEKPLGVQYGHRFNAAHPESAASAGEKRSLELLRQIAALLAPVGANSVEGGGDGADISALGRAGVPLLSPQTSGTHYFDWHHSEADTVDKVDPVEFNKNAAVLAVLAYILADMPETLTGDVATEKK